MGLNMFVLAAWVFSAVLAALATEECVLQRCDRDHWTQGNDIPRGCFLDSPNGAYRLVFLCDGKLVELSDTGGLLWMSTDTETSETLRISETGLVFRNSASDIIKRYATLEKPAAKLVSKTGFCNDSKVVLALDDDGSFRLTRCQGTEVLWEPPMYDPTKTNEIHKRKKRGVTACDELSSGEQRKCEKQQQQSSESSQEDDTDSQSDECNQGDSEEQNACKRRRKKKSKCDQSDSQEQKECERQQQDDCDEECQRQQQQQSDSQSSECNKSKSSEQNECERRKRKHRRKKGCADSDEECQQQQQDDCDEECQRQQQQQQQSQSQSQSDECNQSKSSEQSECERRRRRKHYRSKQQSGCADSDEECQQQQQQSGCDDSDEECQQQQSQSQSDECNQSKSSEQRSCERRRYRYRSRSDSLERRRYYRRRHRYSLEDSQQDSSQQSRSYSQERRYRHRRPYRRYRYDSQQDSQSRQSRSDEQIQIRVKDRGNQNRRYSRERHHYRSQSQEQQQQQQQIQIRVKENKHGNHHIHQPQIQPQQPQDQLQIRVNEEGTANGNPQPVTNVAYNNKPQEQPQLQIQVKERKRSREYESREGHCKDCNGHRCGRHGTCVPGCHSFGECVRHGSRQYYTCLCRKGYSGRHCHKECRYGEWKDYSICSADGFKVQIRHPRSSSNSQSCLRDMSRRIRRVPCHATSNDKRFRSSLSDFCRPRLDGLNPIGKCSNMYVTCLSGKARLITCPRGHAFSHDREMCLPETHIPECHAEKHHCEHRGNGPHKLGPCRDEYLLCVGGAGFTRKCSDGHVFSSEWKACIHHSRSPECGGGPLSEAEHEVPVPGRAQPYPQQQHHQVYPQPEPSNYGQTYHSQPAVGVETYPQSHNRVYPSVNVAQPAVEYAPMPVQPAVQHSPPVGEQSSTYHN